MCSARNVIRTSVMSSFVSGVIEKRQQSVSGTVNRRQKRPGAESADAAAARSSLKRTVDGK